MELKMLFEILKKKKIPGSTHYQSLQVDGKITLSSLTMKFSGKCYFNKNENALSPSLPTVNIRVVLK